MAPLRSSLILALMSHGIETKKRKPKTKEGPKHEKVEISKIQANNKGLFATIDIKKGEDIFYEQPFSPYNEQVFSETLEMMISSGNDHVAQDLWAQIQQAQMHGGSPASVEPMMRKLSTLVTAFNYKQHNWATQKRWMSLADAFAGKHSVEALNVEDQVVGIVDSGIADSTNSFTIREFVATLGGNSITVRGAQLVGTVGRIKRCDRRLDELVALSCDISFDKNQLRDLKESMPDFAEMSLTKGLMVQGVPSSALTLPTSIYSSNSRPEGLYDTSSRINHEGCKPNAKVQSVGQNRFKQTLTPKGLKVLARKDIKAGDEIAVDYLAGAKIGRPERKKELLEKYGIEKDCGAFKTNYVVKDSSLLREDL